MNAYIILFLVIALLVSTLVYFAFSSELAMVAIMFAGSGGVVVLCFVVAWEVKLKKTMYPVRVRGYGERYDSLAVTDDTRAKVIKDKKGYEWLETISGKRFKMPGRKYIMKGNDMHVDLFDTKEQQFPITIDKVNLTDVHKKIIPEDQRVFFADKVIPSIEEATKPPVNQWAQLIPIISVVTLCALMIVAMLFVPEYWAKSDEYSKKFMAALNQKETQLQEYVATSPLVCHCNYDGESAKPEAPPG